MVEQEAPPLCKRLGPMVLLGGPQEDALIQLHRAERVIAQREPVLEQQLGVAELPIAVEDLLAAGQRLRRHDLGGPAREDRPKP